MRREFGLVLLAGAVGAGLVVLAVRQAWAHAVFTPPRPLPAQDIAVTGQQLVPLAFRALLRNRFRESERSCNRQSDRRVASRQFFKQQRILHCRLLGRSGFGIGDGLSQSQLPHGGHDRRWQFGRFVRRAGGR